MIKVTELTAPYDYVVSEKVLETVRALLRATEPEGVLTSIYLEMEGRTPQRLRALKGLGKEIWQDEDAQEYVRRLRAEWDR